MLNACAQLATRLKGLILCQCSPEYICGRCMPGTHEDHKRASDSLKLELQVVVSVHVGVESQIWVL